MIRHYLKVAFRNLLIYKIQNAISICSSAGSMVPYIELKKETKTDIKHENT